MSTVRRTHEDYQIGIICALALEKAAVEAMLDEKHPRLERKQHDMNDYTLGRIGVHNIAIACLPAGLLGNGPAAIVAKDMERSFPIKFGLLVGIGGGVWSKKFDLRLGDIVVSQPEGTHGGVVQWDIGKMEKGGVFRRTGTLNKPPLVLLHALQSMKTKHFKEGDKLSESLLMMFRRNPSMAETFRYPGAEQDQLFEAAYDHEGDETCIKCDISKVVARPARKDSTPKIHYGNIASGNEVMKHGITRDKIAQDEGVICFEMEAAGLMDHFPCLVIRGICDYADSHKNKIWQLYAAAAAAVLATEFLSFVDESCASSLGSNEIRGSLRRTRNPQWLATLQRAGRWQEAVPLQKAELQHCLSLLGPRHLDSLEAMKVLGCLCRKAALFDEANAILKEAIQIAEENIQNQRVFIELQLEQAKLLLLKGFYAGSERLCKKLSSLLEINPQWDGFLRLEIAGVLLENTMMSGQDSTNEVAGVMDMLTHFEAIQVEHPVCLSATLVVGRVYVRAGRQLIATSMFQKVFDSYEKNFGEGHPDTLVAAYLLGETLLDADSKKGCGLIQRALSGLKDILGPKHPYTLEALHLTGWMSISLGTIDVAVGHLERSIQGSCEALGPSHSATILSAGVLCFLFREKGELLNARKVLEPLLEGNSQNNCEDVFNLAAFTNAAGEVFRASKMNDRARELYRRFIAEKASLCQKDFFQLSTMYHLLGQICFEERNFGEAILYFSRAAESRERVLGNTHEDTLASLRRIGICYRMHLNEPKAKEYFLRIHTIRTQMLQTAEQSWGNNHLDTLQAVYNLGVILRDRREFRSAWRVFDRAYRGRKSALGTKHLLTKEAEHMVNLCHFDSDPIARWVAENIFNKEQEY